MCIRDRAGPDHHVPPARLRIAFVVTGGVSVTRESMQKKDRVRSVLVQGAVRLVGKGHRGQGETRIQRDRRELHVLGLDPADRAVERLPVYMIVTHSVSLSLIHIS